MRTIKKFRGDVPPLLKNGEIASNGRYMIMGNNDGNILFDRVFDWEINQTVAGFSYEASSCKFIIPSGTPFSKIQLLLDDLPFNLKTGKTSISIVFENGTYINDMGVGLSIHSYNYVVNFVSQNYYSSAGEIRNVKFESDYYTKVYAKNIYFRGIQFDQQSDYMFYIGPGVKFRMRECSLNMLSNQYIFNSIYSRDAMIEMYRVTFKMYQNHTMDIFRALSCPIDLTDCNSITGYQPRALAERIQAMLVSVGRVDKLGLLQESYRTNEYSSLEVYTSTQLGIPL